MRIGVLFTFIGAGTAEECDTRMNIHTEYRGQRSITATGRECQRWDAQTPHSHDRTAANYPNAGLETNFCRDPIGNGKAWCYTTDPAKRWEACSICQSNASCANDAATNSETCTCNAGYQPEDDSLTTPMYKLPYVRCEDVNECDADDTDCPLGEACVNTIGSHTCTATTTTVVTPVASTPFSYSRDCSSSDSICLKCMPNRMIGSVKLDAIFTESLMGTTDQEQRAELLAMAMLNAQKATGSIGSCATDSNFKFDDFNKVFTFDIALGECAMDAAEITHNGEKYIKFTEKLVFEPAAGAVVFGNVGEFTFACNYKTKSSTNEMLYEVVVRKVGNLAENYLTWDNGMNINFYDDTTFTNTMNPQSLIVGSMFNFEIDWAETFSTQFPVIFYATDCTVVNADETKTYAIIKDACISDLVQAKRFPSPTTMHTPYNSDKLQFSYKSFAFDQTAGSFNLKMSCKVNFCLTSTLPSSINGLGGTCGVLTCPADYSKGI